MKLKYRIIKVKFPTAKKFYLAQYRVKLFIWIPFWMSIGKHRNYYFTWNSNTHYDTYNDAFNAIVKLEEEMRRSNEWIFKTMKVVYDPFATPEL